MISVCFIFKENTGKGGIIIYNIGHYFVKKLDNCINFNTHINVITMQLQKKVKIYNIRVL